jgi:Transcription elongation factor, GreA/GreB, C-term
MPSSATVRPLKAWTGSLRRLLNRRRRPQSLKWSLPQSPLLLCQRFPLPSPLPAAALSEPAQRAPSAAPGQQLLPENLSAESLPVDETGFHLEETQPEIVGPDMAIVLFYPETRNRRTIRISSHDDAPDSNVIHVDRPLARALIGATVDETVELEVSGKRIRMIVEQIYPHLEAAE